MTVDAPSELTTPGLLDPEDELHVYRIIQEAMSNAVRHAHAKHIRIDFSSDGRTLSIEVEDDGSGFDPSKVEEHGLGFAGMRERASIVRGSFDVRSQPGVGTRIALDVPLRSVDQRPTSVGLVSMPSASSR